MGWYLDSSYETKITEIKNMTGDLKLYAKFKHNVDVIAIDNFTFNASNIKELGFELEDNCFYTDDKFINKWDGSFNQASGGVVNTYFYSETYKEGTWHYQDGNALLW